MQDILDRIVKIYSDEGNPEIRKDSPSDLKIIYLYSLYFYFGADTTKLDEVFQTITLEPKIDCGILGIHRNYYNDDIVDFLVPFTVYNDMIIKKEHLEQKMLKAARKIANLFCGNYEIYKNVLDDRYNELDIDDKSTLCVKIITNYNPSPEEKIDLRSFITEYRTKTERINFEIVFYDDLQEVVNDIDSPKKYVPSGIIELYDKNGIAYYGEEKSFIANISATSLKNNYLLYSTRGLFASNLRYYVKSSKIDNAIKKSIFEDPENFWYFNNGIIITCDDYEIGEKNIRLTNFSIVNGGQTTNLIGCNVLPQNFAISCKVIKNKKTVLEDRIDFLSKVAEASNTQKPIKAKDLIANKKEQRMLQMDLEKVGVFVQIKRGEKINKSIYPAPWQNASNDDIAQMLFSVLYQHPGYSRNNKSKLLENDKYYQTIFTEKYNPRFIVSLQYIKVIYSQWLKTLRNLHDVDSEKFGLARNGFLTTIALVGVFAKCFYNRILYNLLSEYDAELISNTNDQFKFIISQNDIGNIDFIKNDTDYKTLERNIMSLFEMIFTSVLSPAYKNYKKKYPALAFSNFTKNDSYYYNYVLPKAILFIKYNFLSNVKLNELLTLCFKSKRSDEIVNFDQKLKFDEYRPGIEEELKEYRLGIFRNSGGKTPQYEVFKNLQLVEIVKMKPKSIDELKRRSGLSEDQCKKFGKDIIQIVQKYSNVNDLI